VITDTFRDKMAKLLRRASVKHPRYFIAWYGVIDGICLHIVDARNTFDLGKYYIVHEVEIHDHGMDIIEAVVNFIAENHNEKPARRR
jgi:hypothetical protein